MLLLYVKGKRYEKQLVDVGFQMDQIDSELNMKLNEVAEFQKTTYLYDTYYPHIELLYYEQMRKQIDSNLTIESFKREVDKQCNSVEEERLDCSSLKK